jgi:hypothetical protein
MDVCITELESNKAEEKDLPLIMAAWGWKTRLPRSGIFERRSRKICRGIRVVSLTESGKERARE